MASPEVHLQEVLNTLTRRNLAGAHPWLMALICPGWPLPSAKADVFPEGLPANAVAGRPKVRRAALVGDVAHHVWPIK
jgi:hypothetical protein